MTSSLVKALLGLMLAWMIVVHVHADNLAANPGFETGAGGPTHSTQTGITTGSAAADWGAFQLSPSFIDTSLVASTDPFAPGGAYMIEVVTDGLENGIAQYPVSPFSFLSADIFVVSGSVHLFATDDFGTTSTEVVTSATGWQHLMLTSPGANEIGIYSHALGGATYYVDNVVATVPEPAAWGVLLAACLVLGLAKELKLTRAGRQGASAYRQRSRESGPPAFGQSQPVISLGAKPRKMSKYLLMNKKGAFMSSA